MDRASVVLLAAVLTATAASAQTTETEPNNSPATANSATLGGTVTGTLRNMGGGGAAEDDSTDWWVLNVTAGQTIYVDVDAMEYGSGADPGLILYASDGVTRLAANDNWDGFDPYLAYVAPTTGKYYVKITAPFGPSLAQPYTIKFTEARCPESSEEPEPDDTPAQAVPISLGQTVHGYVCPMNDEGVGNVDYFKFQATADMKLELQVDTVGRERPTFNCACEITAYMGLSDGTRTLALTNESDYPKRLEYEITTTGTYYVAINMWPAGIRYPYTFRVSSSDTNPLSGVKIATAVAELLHPGTALTAAQLTELDTRGNQNGRYDVGDLRAYLIATGTLTAHLRNRFPIPRVKP